MTKNEFYASLSALKWRGWKLHYGCIRDAENNCPITAVAGAGPHRSAINVGREMGLSKRQRNQIMDAADAHGHFHKHTRAQLLKAVGLSRRRADRQETGQ